MKIDRLSVANDDRAEASMRRSRTKRVAVIATLLALALAVLAGASLLRDDGESAAEADLRAADRTLGALPSASGPRAPQAHTLVGRADLAAMESAGEEIFIGRLIEVGGPEVVTPAGPEYVEVTRHRMRFKVLHSFRGTARDYVDVSVLDGVDPIPATVGNPYLVFAFATVLGTSKTPALIPVGYGQGIYEVSPDPERASDKQGRVRVHALTARNEMNGTVNVGDLARRLSGEG